MVDKEALRNGKYIWRAPTTQVIADGVARRSLLVTGNEEQLGERCQVTVLEGHQDSLPLPSIKGSPW